MPSFDIVSEVNMQEVKNAVEQVRKELETRFDLKGTNSKIELFEKESKIVLQTSDQMKLQSISELLSQRLSKRGVSLKSVTFEEAEKAGGDTLRQEVKVKQSLTDDELKKINKIMKDKKSKLSTRIEGNHLRVTGKKRDELQEMIAFLKAEIKDINLQFTNFRD